MIKAVGFDLGGTLIRYKDIKLTWQDLYRDALTLVANDCNFPIDEQMFGSAEKIFAVYNTRVTPREKEVTAEVIFKEIFNAWNIKDESLLEVAINTFFNFFQVRITLFEDTISTLEHLKDKNIKMGILTDVAYGMSREFVLDEITSFDHLIDCTITSVEVGLRKPNKKGFLDLAKCMGVNPSEMIFVGDEEKDVVGAMDVGMKSIYIDRYDNEINVKADYVVKNLGELINIIDG